MEQAAVATLPRRSLTPTERNWLVSLAIVVGSGLLFGAYRLVEESFGLTDKRDRLVWSMWETSMRFLALSHFLVALVFTLSSRRMRTLAGWSWFLGLLGLGALISCQVVVYRLYAQALGIVVDEIDVQAEGDLDARRLFGIDESVRAGFSDIRLVITITGPETEERYQELRAAVDAHCPVLDLFANPTPVSSVVRKG